jgi:cell division initiation protein
VKKFSKSFRGYNPKEVNDFLDTVITQVDKIVNESKQKDTIIADLQNTINKYKAIENTLNTSIVAAQENGERLRLMAKQEGEAIVSESRKNANRIISDALVRAEKVQYDAEVLKKNIFLFKKRVRGMLEQQLELVDELDKENL